MASHTHGYLKIALTGGAALIALVALTSSISLHAEDRAGGNTMVPTDKDAPSKRPDSPPVASASQEGLVTGTALRTLYLGTIAGINDKSVTLKADDGDILTFSLPSSADIAESLCSKGIHDGSHVAIYSWNDTDSQGALVIDSIHLDQ